jgi:hypothetical protein
MAIGLARWSEMVSEESLAIDLAWDMGPQRERTMALATAPLTVEASAKGLALVTATLWARHLWWELSWGGQTCHRLRRRSGPRMTRPCF